MEGANQLLHIRRPGIPARLKHPRRQIGQGVVLAAVLVVDQAPDGEVVRARDLDLDRAADGPRGERIPDPVDLDDGGIYASEKRSVHCSDPDILDLVVVPGKLAPPSSGPAASRFTITLWVMLSEISTGAAKMHVQRAAHTHSTAQVKCIVSLTKGCGELRCALRQAGRFGAAVLCSMWKARSVLPGAGEDVEGSRCSQSCLPYLSSRVPITCLPKRDGR